MDRIRFLIILLIIFCSCNQTKQKSLDTNDLKLYGFEPVEIQTTAHFRGISVVDHCLV